MARLNLFERLVVLNEFRRIVKIDDQFNVAVRQESFDRVQRSVAFIEKEVVDELV